MPITQPSSAIRAGTVAYFAANSTPPGWIKCNGAQVSRSVYGALFTAIGTTYGAGDGSTTFNVPDLRGEFIRSFDDGRGVDSGRVFGAAQTDEFRSHTHEYIAGNGMPGGPQTAQYAYHLATSNFTNARGGTETRPRNVAMLACIKF